VAPGETFYSISRKYNLKVEDLKTLNGLGDAPLSVGQVLKVK
jgi:LysM repeat protein